MLKRIVWPSVLAVVLATGSVITAVLEMGAVPEALGFSAVVAAVLATRVK